MDWTVQDLGAVGEFVSSIAVLVTLVYLAIQTRQSKDAVLQASRLNMMDQRVRNLWAESDSSYIAPLIVKAEKRDPLDEEDVVRVRALMRAELIRCRFMFRNGLTAYTNAGTIFGSLAYFAEVFGSTASQIWEDYRDDTRAEKDFIEWMEANVSFA